MNINIGKLLQVAPSTEATAAAAMAPKSSQPSKKSTLAAQSSKSGLTG